VEVAVALSEGVSADECEAFTLVFDELDGVEVIGVGASVGHVNGQGGGWYVDAVFDDVAHPDVVIVPGGLGCARTAHDDALLSWLRSVAPLCRWMAASSTGTVVVAAAGLLDEREAATHWLAAPLLESYGSTASRERIVEVGNIITCEGHVTAMHVALLVTMRLRGPAAVAQVRERLAQRDRQDSVPERRWWGRHRAGSSRPRAAAPRRPSNPELVAPDDIELEPLRRLR
jgi:transcriptional regulator GlxA family with amidase domain